MTPLHHEWSLWAQGQEEWFPSPLGKGEKSVAHLCEVILSVSAGAAVVSSNPGVRVGDQLDLLWQVLASGASKERPAGRRRAMGGIVPAGPTTLLREAEDEFFSFQKRASLSIQRNKVRYFKRRETAGK